MSKKDDSGPRLDELFEAVGGDLELLEALLVITDRMLARHAEKSGGT